MPYNFAADSFHTNKLCSTLSSSEVDFLDGNDKIVAFEVPSGGLGAMQLFILGSLESSYWAPISHNWTFFAISNGWAATSEYRVKIAVFEAGWVSLIQNFR